MLQTPSSLNDAAAAPRTDAPWLAMAGWNTAQVRPAAIGVPPAPNSKVWRKFGGGMITLLPSDVPCPDDGKPVPHTAPARFFKHIPIVTRRVGDKVEIVTGPVEPIVPHTDATTQEGWRRYFQSIEAARAAVIAKAKVVAEEHRTYWKARADKDEADWQARCKRALEKGRPLPKRPVRKPAPPGWEMYVQDPVLMHHIIGARSAANKRQRIRRAKVSGRFADRNYETVTEKFAHEDGTPAPALRGWLGILSLALLNSSLEKGKNVTYGYDKTAEFSSGFDRIATLDAAYIVFDKMRRCAFVVDLDGWWPDMATLRKVLRTLLPPEFMPNVITYRGRESDGLGVENPHLVWYLPPGARVIARKGKKKRQQFKLHEMIQRGIVSLLIPIGADPGHTNTHKTKNSLSAGWSVECCDDHFQTMNAWRGFLPTITPNINEMRRRAKILKAAKVAGVEPKESMAIWNDGVTYRRLEIASAETRKDPEFLAAVRQSNRKKVAGPFADWLYAPVDGVVTRRLVSLHGDTHAVRAVIAAQRAFVVELNLTPSEVGSLCNRGRDAEENAKLEPLPSTATAEDRKAREKLIKHRARQRTQAFKEDVHRGVIAEAIELRLGSGVPVVKAEIVKALVSDGNIGRSTAYRLFDDVFEVVQRTARYQVHPQISKQAQASQPVEFLLRHHHRRGRRRRSRRRRGPARANSGPNHRLPCLGRGQGFPDAVGGGLSAAGQLDRGCGRLARCEGPSSSRRWGRPRQRSGIPQARARPVLVGRSPSALSRSSGHPGPAYLILI